MTDGGRSRVVLASLLAAGALLVAGGCSKLTASLDKQDMVTLGDLAARVSALEQQVQDLQAGVFQETNGQAVAEPSEAGQDAATNPQKVDASRPNTGTRAVVTASPVLNVRAQPDPKAEKIGALAEGAIVQVVAVEGDWAKVKFTFKDRLIQGWVANQFLDQQE